MLNITKPAPKAKPVSMEKLQEAFSLVSNKRDWKKPINRVVKDCSEEKAVLIESAILNLTGSLAGTCRVGNNVRFTASGYYSAIGC